MIYCALYSFGFRHSFFRALNGWKRLADWQLNFFVRLVVVACVYGDRVERLLRSVLFALHYADADFLSPCFSSAIYDPPQLIFTVVCCFSLFHFFLYILFYYLSAVFLMAENSCISCSLVHTQVSRDIVKEKDDVVVVVVV